MKISEIMRSAPWVVEGVDSLGTAHQMMQQHAIHHLPVVKDGKLAGMLAERDILAYRASLGAEGDWTRAAVASVMTRSPQTAGPGDSLTEVAGRFAAGAPDGLPVVERGKLLGIVTVTDILAAEVQRAMAPSSTSATAATAMTIGPYTIGGDANLFDAARKMSAYGIRHLPVIDEAGVVIGMLSERDLRTYIGDPSKFVISHGHTAKCVRDAMMHGPITVTRDRPLVEVAKLFEDHRIGAVPVVDREGKPLGIVSYIDVLRLLAPAS